MPRQSTDFAEFVLSREAEIQTKILPILDANRKVNVKTLIFKRDLEGGKVHVTCIGVKVPRIAPDEPEYQLIALRPGQAIDLSVYAKAEIDPVGLKFGQD